MKVTDYQVDALKELINIGVGRAAGSLHQMLHTHVSLKVPHVEIFSPSELKGNMLKEEIAERLTAVRMVFGGPFGGSASLVFPPDSATKLVDVVTGDERGRNDLDAIRVGALTEVGNIVLNGVMGSIGNIIKRRISYGLPVYMEDTLENLLTPQTAEPIDTILLARTHFKIEQFKIEGDIILLFEIGSFDALLAAINALKEGLRDAQE